MLTTVKLYTCMLSIAVVSLDLIVQIKRVQAFPGTMREIWDGMGGSRCSRLGCGTGTHVLVVLVPGSTIDKCPPC